MPMPLKRLSMNGCNPHSRPSDTQKSPPPDVPMKSSKTRDPLSISNPFLQAVDNGEIQLNDKQKKRLAIVQRIYQLAFVEGFVRPGRENEPPLRLTPNTDFGGWAVQEGLDIYENDRTLLTYIFRGFGWMMDAREQLPLKIIRPVIPPQPDVIPQPTDDMTIANEVVALHNRMASTNAF